MMTRRKNRTMINGENARKRREEQSVVVIVYNKQTNQLKKVLILAFNSLLHIAHATIAS